MSERENTGVLDEELGDSLVALHECQVVEEESVIRGMVEGSGVHTEIEAEISETLYLIDEAEDLIQEELKSKKRYTVSAVAVFALCVITLVARLIAG